MQVSEISRAQVSAWSGHPSSTICRAKEAGQPLPSGPDEILPPTAKRDKGKGKGGKSGKGPKGTRETGNSQDTQVALPSGKCLKRLFSIGLCDPKRPFWFPDVKEGKGKEKAKGKGKGLDKGGKGSKGDSAEGEDLRNLVW